MIVTAFALLILADIGPSGLWGAKPRPPDECSKDDDCDLSTFAGCCGACCQPAPHATRKGLDEKAKCAAASCAAPNCDAVRCKSPQPLKDFRAICRIGQCAAVAKKGPLPPLPLNAPECRVDTDCKMVFEDWSEKYQCLSAEVLAVDPGAQRKDRWGKALPPKVRTAIPKGAKPCDLPDAVAICDGSGRCAFGSKRLQAR